jgi:hypothetical protein
MARQSKQEKAIEKRVEAAYYASCSGIQINMMDIPKVFKVGAQIVSEGADDATLQAKLRAFVDTIRHN